MEIKKDATWGEIFTGCLFSLALYVIAMTVPLAIATIVVVGVMKLLGVCGD